MATVTDILRIAANEVGYSRWDDPESGTKYGRWYAQVVNNPYYGTNGVPYCAMFASWVFAQAGQSMPGLPTASCSTIVSNNRNTSRHIKNKKDAQPGDIILFDWDGDSVADHVGIAELNKGSYLQTIEGNTSSGTSGSQSNGGHVARRTRDWSTILYVFRPNYDTTKVLSQSDFAAIGNQAYTGRAIEPQVSSTTGVTFSVSYKNNVEIGYGQVICTGTGNYTGSVDLNFKILPAHLVKYEDVDPTAWYVATMNEAVSLGFLSGYDTSHLGPSDACTRANAVCMIANAAGYEAPQGFEDVPQPTYYYEALEWAREQGIVHGVDNNFYPENPCLRCDFIVMLYNWSGTPDIADYPTSYADWKDVPEYAQAAMAWGVKNKILSGHDNKLTPINNCSRAEAAAMLVNHSKLKD